MNSECPKCGHPVTAGDKSRGNREYLEGVGIGTFAHVIACPGTPEYETQVLTRSKKNAPIVPRPCVYCGQQITQAPMRHLDGYAHRRCIGVEAIKMRREVNEARFSSSGQ